MVIIKCKVELVLPKFWHVLFVILVISMLIASNNLQWKTFKTFLQGYPRLIPHPTGIKHFKL